MWTPDPSDMQNAPNFGAMAPQAPSIPQTNPATWNSDFSGQLNNMIAPYQQMAKQYGNNGYASMSGNSWLAQAHPGIARPLDNALLAMSMTKPGQTIGENISNVAGGLVGAQGYRRQQMMQSAMLPYELAEPRLKMMDTMAQMQQRGAMTQADIARIPLDRAQTEWYARRMQQPNATEVDQITAMRKLGIDDINKMTPDQATKFEQEMEAQRQRSTSGAGLTPGQIVAMQMSDDPAMKEKGKQAEQIYTAMMGGIAGQKTGASDAAAEPTKAIDEEVKNAYKLYQPTKAMTAPEFYTTPEGINAFGAEMQNPKLRGQGYNAYLAGVEGKNIESKSKLDSQVSAYRQWAKKNPGQGFQAYLTATQGGGPTSGGDSGATAPSNNPFHNNK